MTVYSCPELYAIIPIKMLILFGLIIFMELVLYATWPTKYLRLITVAALIPAVAFITTVLTLQDPSVLQLLVAYFSIFRILNLLRIAESRMHETYMRSSVVRCGLALLGVQIVLLVMILQNVDGRFDAFLPAVASFQLFLASILLISTVRTLIKSRRKESLEYYSDKELPTVTVAIPARNETKDLEACLDSVLLNDYPKLEVIVLDDCSHDKTSDIIKRYAHSGVRFVQGNEPGATWLAKNWAYQRLYEESNGKFLLFCGVDARLGKNAIRALVTMAMNRNKNMISVLPQRSRGGFHIFIQPLRYWWEITLPRRLFNRPPTLSTCWMIRRNALKRLGSFKAVRQSVLPEAYFSRELAKLDGYTFALSDSILNVTTEKSLTAQQATAIRVRYPQLHKRLELLSLHLLLLLAFIIGPFVLAFMWLIGLTDLSSPVITAGILMTIQGLILFASDRQSILIGSVVLPIAIVIEFAIAVLSMWRYEFSKVIWKGRNVCLPVMSSERSNSRID